MENWIDRAQSAEAKLNTLRQAHEPTLERIRAFKENFGIKENSRGDISIDFDKFVESLGEKGCLELRNIIDETY